MSIILSWQKLFLIHPVHYFCSSSSSLRSRLHRHLRLHSEWQQIRAQIMTDADDDEITENFKTDVNSVRSPNTFRTKSSNWKRVFSVGNFRENMNTLLMLLNAWHRAVILMLWTEILGQNSQKTIRCNSDHPGVLDFSSHDFFVLARTSLIPSRQAFSEFPKIIIQEWFFQWQNFLELPSFPGFPELLAPWAVA